MIGSGPDCGVRIDAPGIEAQHARIVIEITGATIYRIDGIVGVNDDVVLGDALLRSGDFVWLGEPGGASSLMLQFTLGDVEEPAAADALVVPAIEAPSEELVEEVSSDDLTPQASDVHEVVVEEAAPAALAAETADVEMMEMAPEPLLHEASVEETLVEEVHVEEAPLAAETPHEVESADLEPTDLSPADLEPISELEPSFAAPMEGSPFLPLP